MDGTGDTADIDDGIIATITAPGEETEPASSVTLDALLNTFSDLLQENEERLGDIDGNGDGK